MAHGETPPFPKTFTPGYSLRLGASFKYAKYPGKIDAN